VRRAVRRTGARSRHAIGAGVVLSERLAVTMYGAIHRAQFSGKPNLRGLVLDPKLLVSPALTDARASATAVAVVGMASRGITC
jgi:hypothetical protein